MSKIHSNTKKYWILSIVVINFILMGVVDAVIVPEYFTKSAIKIILFAIVPLLYYFISKDSSIKELLKPNKKGLIQAFAVGVGVFAIILGGYYLVNSFMDFGNITTALGSDVGVDANNFIFVSTYIALVNSFLEEFFFRGFAFLSLNKQLSIKASYVFSSAVFALYHVAIMLNWFSLPLFTITLLGLFVGGLIFNYFNIKYNNIYCSWIIHIFANLAINTIGFILFGII